MTSGRIGCAFRRGASGGIGRLVMERGLARGHSFTALSRESLRIPHLPRVIAVEGHATHGALLRRELPGHDAVISALGTTGAGAPALFSNATRALFGAMPRHQRRLMAITGVDTGETRGHGGFLHDRILFPLLTRHPCVDEERQEALIAASGLDWTIVRPARFAHGIADELSKGSPASPPTPSSPASPAPRSPASSSARSNIPDSSASGLSSATAAEDSAAGGRKIVSSSFGSCRPHTLRGPQYDGA